MLPLAQPPRKDDRSFDDWMFRLWKRIASQAGLAWDMVSKTGSNLTDIETRNHADLQNLNTASYTHLTATDATDLTDGGLTTLHKHGEIYVPVTNKTGVTINKMAVVYINGAQGSKATIALAKADAEVTSTSTIGLVTANITDNLSGLICTSGELTGLDTSSYTNGDSLWLSPTVAGGVTVTKPTAPNHAVFVGIVSNAHANQGAIVISIQNGHELAELHDVKLTSVTDGQALIYNAATSLWVNGTVSGGGGGSPNLDGGLASSTYGGISPIEGGGA